MNNDYNFSRIVQVVNQQNILGICLPANPSLDTVAAATALYLGLSKMGKDVSLACASDLPPQFNLNGADKIQKNLGAGGNNLVISFPYVEGAIDKVTYNIEGEYFNLVIQPKEGMARLDPSNVKYSYTGAKIGAIITIDASNLNALGELYSRQREEFQGKDIINIDRHLTNANFGTINLVEKQSSSTSEIIFKLLQLLHIEIDKDMATNLYAGIMAATNNFTAYSVNANTFETSAQLLKLGAVKKPHIPSRFKPPTMTFSPTPAGNSWTPPAMETPAPSPKTVEVKEGKNEEKTANDWLKPKIFRGSNLI
jgi:nanoRNase/pAp phosphatase (c-di-AMP/oligoRNAs hydrolase)